MLEFHLLKTAIRIIGLKVIIKAPINETLLSLLNKIIKSSKDTKNNAIYFDAQKNDNPLSTPNTR